MSATSPRRWTRASRLVGEDRADCEIFVSAAHFAHLCAGEDLPTRVRRSREGGVLPGTERQVRLGGSGTPKVAEFAAAELGARLRMGTRGARA